MSSIRLLRVAVPLLAMTAASIAGCRLSERVVDPGVQIDVVARDDDQLLHSGKNRNSIRYGPSVRVGDGRARIFVEYGRRHRPEALGILMTQDALTGHPATGETEYVLDLPRGVRLPPYTHATVNFNPQGHPPPGIYTVPHFDFHFFLITKRQRARIDGSSGGEDPAPRFIPEDYISTVDVVPHMGVHWVDPTSAEFQAGGQFTRTFIYGFLGGVMAFVEPMATVDFLDSGDSSDPVKQPQAFQRSGYYPNRYSVSHDDRDRIVITLEDLDYHRALRSKKDR